MEAAALWADTGNEVALATNALLRARHAGDRLSEDVAWQRLHRLGVCDDVWHIAGPLAAIGPPPVPEVAVQTLGHLAVLLSGTPVPPAGWQSRKARELVKVLAGQLGRPVTRTALAALLWPQTPSEVANRRLSVLISTVRAVLDPARRHPANRFLVTDPSSVWLNTKHVVLDTVRFHDAARSSCPRERRNRPGQRGATCDQGREPLRAGADAVAGQHVEGDHTAEGACNNHPRAGLVQFGANFVADAFADVVVKVAVELAHEAQQPAAHITTDPPVCGDEGAGDGARYIGDAEAERLGLQQVEGGTGRGVGGERVEDGPAGHRAPVTPSRGGGRTTPAGYGW
ncbi:winged helix-turn-helix domain-containing protein [Streptomyces sp. NPDC056930]|uniref:AfsR/SARP family transcriptional regulator n=1 Tax=Streptomyces sp. NPDC056930 TaxID=3345967 RepID=UPI00362550E9